MLFVVGVMCNVCVSFTVIIHVGPILTLFLQITLITLDPGMQTASFPLK